MVRADLQKTETRGDVEKETRPQWLTVPETIGGSCTTDQPQALDPNGGLRLSPELLRTISNAASTDQLAQLSLAYLCRRFACQRTSLAILSDAEPTALVLTTSSDALLPERLTSCVKPLGELALSAECLDCFRQGKFREIADLTLLSEIAAHFVVLRDEGMRAMLQAPLLVQGHCLGILSLERATPGDFSLEQKKELGEMAMLLAIGVRSVRLLEQVHEQAVELAELRAKRKVVREEKLRLLGRIADTAPSIIYLHDVTTQCNLFINRQATRILGYSPEQLSVHGAQVLPKIIHSEDFSRLQEHLAYCTSLADGEFGEIEFRLKDAQGVWHWLHSRTTVFARSEGGKAHLLLLRADDMTENKQMENALRESEARFRAMADSAPVLLWFEDPHGAGVFFNKTWLDFTGRTLEQEQGDGWLDNLHPDDRLQCLADSVRVLQERKPFQCEYRLRRADGEYRWIWDVSVPRFTLEGEFLGFIGSGIDVTDRKRAEEERDRFFNLSLDLLCIGSLDEFFERLNPAWESTLGFSREELTARSWLEFVHPEDQAATHNVIEQLSSGVDVVNFENRYRCKDGSYRWLAWTVKAARPEKEKATVYGVARDVTERKNAEEVLRASQELFLRFMDHSPTTAFIKDEDGRYLYINPAGEQAASVKASRWRGKTDRELWPAPAVNQRLRANDLIALQENQTVIDDYELEMQSGKQYWMVFHFPLMHVNGQRLSGGVAINMTEQRKMEQRLRLQEAMFRTLAETTPAFVFIHQDGKFLYVNSAAEKVLGYSQNELLSIDPLSLVHPDFHPQLYGRLRGEQTPSQYEMVLLHKSGAQRPVVYSENLIEVDGRPAIFGSAFDLTTLKKMEEERRQLQQQLFQAQKLEALGELAGGIAHDFNNMLSPILGFTELTLEVLPEGSEERNNLDEVMLAGKRAKKLVQQILRFGRPQTPERMTLPLDHIVQEALPLLRSSLPTTIAIRYFNNHPSLCVDADPTQMQQLLMNLCVNAKQAMGEQGGVLEITVARTRLPKTVAEKRPDIASGSYGRLTIRDTGAGIAPELLGKIFDPFFTTNPVGEGSGLGLSIVHGVVTSHGGYIEVESTPGVGTAFYVYLPEVLEPNFAAEDDALPVHQGKGRVLFVDDDLAVARISRLMLEHCGYDVVVATDAHNALQLFEQMPHAFTLVMTDQIMPGMTGGELAQRLLQIRADLPIILCTGFSETLDDEEAKALGIREFLMKPLSLQELSAVLTRVTLNC